MAVEKYIIRQGRRPDANCSISKFVSILLLSVLLTTCFASTVCAECDGRSTESVDFYHHTREQLEKYFESTKGEN